MGGYNSGRHGARSALDSDLVLDINKLRRDGLLRSHRGSLNWTETDTGRQVASIGFDVQIEDETRGWVRLHYVVTAWDGQKRSSDYRVYLVSTAQPFGGRRWWFICPRIGDRVSKLYKPAGASTFLSREAHGRGYRSQRRTPYDQAINQAFKLRRQLGDHGAIDDLVWQKPKWMRRRTFDRKVERIETVEARVNSRIANFMARLARRGISL